MKNDLQIPPDNFLTGTGYSPYFLGTSVCIETPLYTNAIKSTFRFTGILKSEFVFQFYIFRNKKALVGTKQLFRLKLSDNHNK